MKRTLQPQSKGENGSSKDLGEKAASALLITPKPLTVWIAAN